MPISPESRFILTSMVEECHITSDVEQGCYNAPINVDGLLDRFEEAVQQEGPSPTGAPPSSTALIQARNFTTSLQDAFTSWFDNTQPMMRVHTALDGIYHAYWQLSGIVDYTVYNSVQVFLRQGFNTSTATTPFPLSLPTIPTPNLLPMQVPKIVGGNHWCALLNNQYVRIVTCTSQSNVSQLYPDFVSSWQPPSSDWDNAGCQPIGVPKLTYKVRKKQRRLDRKARKVVRRGIKILDSMLGQVECRKFLAGQFLKVSGTYFDYRLEITGELRIRSVKFGNRIPYDLSIVAKNDGRYLGSICLVFENTPVLDQVAGFLMHLTDPKTEMEFLRISHISCRDQQARDFLTECGCFEPLPDNEPVENTPEELALARTCLERMAETNQPLEEAIIARADEISQNDEYRQVARQSLAERAGIPTSVLDFLYHPHIPREHLNEGNIEAWAELQHIMQVR